MKIDEILQEANKLYSCGEYNKALRCIEKILQRDAYNIAAIIIKGNIMHQTGNMSEALIWYKRALSGNPHNVIAWVNCANVYFETQKYLEAYKCSHQALVLDSKNKNALILYGNSAIELEEYEEAKKSFLQVLEVDSQDYWCYNSLSQVYQKNGDEERALAYGWQAVELSRGDKNQQINFGYMLYEISQGINKDIARYYAQKWLEKYSSDLIVNHMANAVLQNQTLTRANEHYVQEIFDVFADDFEKVLADLSYRVPQLFEEELRRAYQSYSHVKLRILDAGCGTGLCGNFLKKYARLWGLYGLDLSEQMLKHAAQKKVYNKLIHQDFEEYLTKSKSHFDLIVAADVFTYFGELQNLIKGCHNILSKNGRILFSVTANKENNSNYSLHPSGRFLHNQKYVENLLNENGFMIDQISEHTLRTEGDKDVCGYIIDALKKV